MLIDSHCHLYLLENTDGGRHLEAVMLAAQQHDVQQMLCVCVDLDIFERVLAIAKEHPNVHCSVGVHPCDIGDTPITKEQIAHLAMAPEVIAIGETGLDYYRLESDEEEKKRKQHAAFRAQIQAAIGVNKPLIIHTRAAQADTIRLLREEGADRCQGVMHCFTEDFAMAEEAIELGFYISISGIVTFKNALQVQEVAKRVPLNRLLIETDAPYLAPVPYRGQENQPAYVRYVAEYIAELRGISFEEVAENTTENYFTLFKGAKIHV